MSEKRKVVYKKEFENDFVSVHSFISENSGQNAKKFAQDVKTKIEWIMKNPMAGTVETRIHSKQNWYRYKTVMTSWKIVYKVTKSLLVFLGIIHVKRHPDKIKNLRTNNYE